MMHQLSRGIGDEVDGLLSRRLFLRRLSIIAAGTCLLPSANALAKSLQEKRTLAFYNLHTDETLEVVCCPQIRIEPKALKRFSYLLRDHRTGEVKIIDPALLDILYGVSAVTGSRGVYQIISGYRSPKTNAKLRKMSSGVAKYSLHMDGKAIDVRLTDVDTKTLQQVSIALKRGGVGYYRQSDFVHLDTGPVRSW